MFFYTSLQNIRRDWSKGNLYSRLMEFIENCYKYFLFKVNFLRGFPHNLYNHIKFNELWIYYV